MKVTLFWVSLYSAFLFELYLSLRELDLSSFDLKLDSAVFNAKKLSLRYIRFVYLTCYSEACVRGQPLQSASPLSDRYGLDVTAFVAGGLICLSQMVLSDWDFEELYF